MKLTLYFKYAALSWVISKRQLSNIKIILLHLLVLNYLTAPN